MMRRIKLYSIFFAIGLTLLILVQNEDLKNPVKRNARETKENEGTRYWNTPKQTVKPPNINDILESTRRKIRTELRDYNFTYSGARRLEDLVMETGGKPLRSVIISSWRSGTTFLGEVLNAMPANFYHYQPLLKFGHVQIPDALAPKAVGSMKSMFNCNFENMNDYFDYGLRNDFQFSHNKRLWEHCKDNTELCQNPEFVANFCQLFPFQSMKVVRLRLRYAEEILADAKLNVKVVFLTRDPRGVMQSRLHRGFCRVAPDCSSPEILCEGMLSDYITARRLLKLYPDKLIVLRFEEISLDVERATEKLFKFLGLGKTEALQEFLDSHTHTEVSLVNSTYRVSRDVPFRWKKSLDFRYADKIQTVCKEAMHYWGYRLAYNASHMASEDFEPVAPFSLKSNL